MTGAAAHGACRDCAQPGFGGPADNRFTAYDAICRGDLCGAAGLPQVFINTSNLTLFVAVTDLTFGGPSPGFSLDRSFNQDDTRAGPFGVGWSFNLGETLKPDADGTLVLRSGSGRIDRFATAATGSGYFAVTATADTVTLNSDGTYTLAQSRFHLVADFCIGRETDGHPELGLDGGLAGLRPVGHSKLCKDIDERVHAFLDRPLAGEWPYLWLDATYLKQREGGRIVSVAAIIAVAANTDGRREIVGLHIGPSEAETFWSSFLKSLARRGLRGVKLVISDAHEGLKAAIRRVFGAGLAALPRALDAQRSGLCAQDPAEHGGGGAAPGVSAARSGPGQRHAAPCRRPVAAEMAEARRVHRRQRDRCPVLSGFPRAAPQQITQHQPARTAQQGGQAARRCRRHLPK